MEIIGELGKGAHGIVYLTKVRRDDSMFAFKTMNEEYQDEFVKERRIMQKLKSSPYVVKFYGCKNITSLNRPDLWGLSLEYAQGGDLTNLIKSKGGRLLESDVKIYTRMILQGLCDIHSIEHVHCDLKPENILVFPSSCGGEPTLKITDFALAKEPGEVDEFDKDSTECIDKFRGTPLYMSPESVQCGYISPGLDIWSLGCIIIQMITGNPPWPHKKLKDLLETLLSSGASPKLPENMSENGISFLRACLHYDVYLRSSATELLNHPFVRTN